jgi:hypothetical protein
MEDLVAERELCLSAFDAIMEKHGFEKIKTDGDAYLSGQFLSNVEPLPDP